MRNCDVDRLGLMARSRGEIVSFADIILHSCVFQRRDHKIWDQTEKSTRKARVSRKERDQTMELVKLISCSNRGPSRWILQNLFHELSQWLATILRR